MSVSITYNPDMASRLDQFLFEYLRDNLPDNQGEYITRSSIIKYVGEVSVNGKDEKKGFKLRDGDEVTIDIDNISRLIAGEIESKEGLTAEKGELEIVEESREWMVIKKPKGLVVHPGEGNWNGTLANIVKGYLESKNEYEEGLERAGIVHRLDKGVSGLMIVAKTLRMQKYLKEQFESHKVAKIYRARVKPFSQGNSFIVDKRLESSEVVDSFINNDFQAAQDWIKMEGYIGRNPFNRRQMSFSPSPKDSYKYSLMYIKPLSASEILINLKTGRMHQIRASLKYMGYHIEGDELYGPGGDNGSNELHLEEILLGCQITPSEFKYWRL